MLDLRSSLYARGILFVGLVCLILIGLDLGQSWSAHEARMHEAKTETENLARSLAQHAQDVFETGDAILKGLRDAVIHDGTGPAAIPLLEHRMQVRAANQAEIDRLFVFDEHGNWVASSLPGPEFDAVRSLNYTERDFFRFHREHSEDILLIGSPIRTRLDGTWVITLSRRLNTPDGGFAGVAGVSIRIDLFQRFFKTFDIGAQGAIALVNGQGAILVRRPFDENNRNRNISRSPSFQEAERSADTGSYDYTSPIDGTPRLGSFHRVQGFDLMMFVALDKNEVLAAWWAEAKVQLLWLAFIIFLFVTLGYRLTIQIRDRVAAEAISQRLQLEADQRLAAEAERRRYQRELEQQKQELERSNSALEQFAYAASHDLQSPLRAMAHLAQWIDEDVRATASPETAGHLTLLNGRVARLQMLVSGLLAYARVGRTDLVPENVDIAAAVRDVVAMLDAPPGFVVECEGEMSPIRTNRTPLELVLKNLISNAQQHHDCSDGRVTVSMSRKNGLVEIRVSDDGPGIEHRYHDEIFVIFKTLHSRDDSESGGIGLAMVKKQVTEHGGRVWVESDPPARGTTFAFTWQVAAA